MAVGYSLLYAQCSFDLTGLVSYYTEWYKVIPPFVSKENISYCAIL